MTCQTIEVRATLRSAGVGMALWIGLLLVGCGEARQARPDASRGGSSRVDVFIRPLVKETLTLHMEFEALALRDGDGVQHPLVLSRKSLASDSSSRRIAIAGGPVPPQTYTTLLITLRQVQRQRGDRRSQLRLLGSEFQERIPPAGGPPELEPRPALFEVPIALGVGPRQAASLFLDWDVEASLVEVDGFRPAFTVSFETPQVRLGLLYVVDRDTDSILALNRFNGQVVATAKVGSRPLRAAVSRDRRRLFVANRGDGSVSIVDAFSNKTLSRLNFGAGSGTSDVVLFDALRRGAAVQSLDDTVALFSTVNGVTLSKIRVGRSPTRAASAPNLRRLFVVNSLSDSLSVIDMSTGAVIATLDTAAQPADVAVDPRRSLLAVCHRTSWDLLLFNAASLERESAIRVGGSMDTVLAGRRSGRVYVARSHPPEIVEVDRSLAAVVRRIPIRAAVTSLVQPKEGPFVYGSCPSLGGVIVVNVVRGREEDFLACGTAPVDVVVLE